MHAIAAWPPRKLKKQYEEQNPALSLDSVDRCARIRMRPHDAPGDYTSPAGQGCPGIGSRRFEGLRPYRGAENSREPEGTDPHDRRRQRGEFYRRLLRLWL